MRFHVCVCITLLIFMTSVGTSRAQITFYTEDGIITQEVAQLFLGNDFELAEPMINYTSIYVDIVDKNQDVSGLIVITPTVNPIEPNIRLLQQNGALAVVVAHDSILVPGRSIFNVDGSQGRGITIHAFEVGSSTVPLLPSIYKSSDARVIISIQSTGNKWVSIPENRKFQMQGLNLLSLLSNFMTDIDIAFSIVIGAGAAWCVGLAAYKLALFRKTRAKFTRSIPQTCLTLHMVANLLRLIYVVVDPLGFRRIWTFYADNVFYTITYPITIVASLLMSLYWVEAMSSASLVVYPGLKKMRTPFIVFSVSLGVLEIISDIVRSVGIVGASLTLTISVVIYLVAIAGMCIFYMIASILLLKRMKSSQTVSKKANFLKRVTWLIISSVIFYWIFFFCIVAFTFAAVSGSVPGWLTINFVSMLAIIGVSTCQILVFNPRATKSSSSSGGRKDYSDTTTAMSTINTVS